MPRRVKWKRNGRRYKNSCLYWEDFTLDFETLKNYTNKKYKKLKTNAYFYYSGHGFTNLHSLIVVSMLPLTRKSRLQLAKASAPMSWVWPRPSATHSRWMPALFLVNFQSLIVLSLELEAKKSIFWLSSLAFSLPPYTLFEKRKFKLGV